MATPKRASAASSEPIDEDPVVPVEEVVDTASPSVQDRVRGAAVTGVAVGRAAASAALAATARAAAQVRGAAADAVDSVKTGPASAPDAAAGGLAGVSIRVPFVSASVRLPAPGATAGVGPVTLTLPTGALYYGGLAVLAVAGAVELPVAVAAGVAGAVLGRRWLRGVVPTLSVVDAHTGSSPAAGSAAKKPAHPIVPE